MKAPEKPRNEPQRLDALRFLSILDTPVEERFDRLTRLAQKLFGVPIALISLVDAERQWFKSRQGLSACETSRELSFCGHAILGNGIFEISDATQDERFADNPLVTGAPNIRFYAGAPLVTANGYNLGTLCLIDDKPRELSQSDRSALRDLADAVEHEINQTQLREKTRHLQKAQAELGRLSLVARQTNNGVVIINRAQQIEWVNDSFTRFTGLGIEELRERPFDQILRVQGVADEAVGNMLSRLQESQPFQYEFSYRTRSGRVEWFQINWDPFYSDEGSDDGRHSGFIGLISLITREKTDAQKIRESEQKFRSLVNNIPGITYRCLLDEHWTMLFMSDQVDPLSGYPASDFINNAVRSYASVIHPEDQADTAFAVDQALANGTDWLIEYRIVHRDGGVRWAMERGSAVRDESGQVRFLDGFILDITSDRQNRELIQRQLDAFITLNTIASNRALETSEQLQRALRLGANYLGLDIGIVSRIRDQKYRVRHCVAPASVALEPGQCFDLENTYCDITLKADDLVAIHHMEGSEYRGHPCYRSFALEAYIGMALDVNGERYGTVNFSSAAPRETPFSASEKMFVRLLVRWMGSVIENERSSRALKLNEARLRGLFELSPIGIALNDYETGAFIDLNDALVRPTGYTREQFIGLKYWDLTPREYEAEELLQRQSMEQAQRYGPYEKEYIRQDGSRYPVLLNGMVVYEPSGRKLIWSMVEDISERKRVERMKSEFISTVSHELRTPLTTIAGALGLVVGGVFGELPGRSQELLEAAHKNSQRLHLLINDLLDMEKLVAGKMHFEMKAQSLKTLLEQAVKDTQIYADQFDVRLELVLTPGDDAVEVMVDAHRLQQVMANLLSNAAKFSHLGGEVNISVLRRADAVRVQVADHGMGIPIEFQSRIFDKFAQADASDTRQKGGTGLGLAITRELVERMGGTVGFDSVRGQGAMFYFELPLGVSKQ